MMRMTCASLCKFYGNVDKSIMKHLSSWRKRKGCHDDDNKTVPRQRSGFDNSLRRRCKRKCDVGVSCDERLGASGYRVPTCRRQGNEELAKNNSDTVQPRSNRSISYNTSQAFAHGHCSDGYTLQGSILRMVQVQRGSSCSREGSRSRGT